MNSQIEENYLKAIFKLEAETSSAVGTSALASEMGVQSASVTDMIKKLSAKGLTSYQKYKGVSLTEKGRMDAKRIIRKHRLWEVFLVEKLGFSWGDVHEVAEQLEHVRSKELVSRLDAYLGYPTIDPHGDPIPDEEGHIAEPPSTLPLSELQPGEDATVAGVQHDGRDLLEYLDRNGLSLRKKVSVVNRLEFDGSLKVSIDGREVYFSEKMAGNILVIKT
jgi:DtxR family Mn-dependent transcriptional regulator